MTLFAIRKSGGADENLTQPKGLFFFSLCFVWGFCLFAVLFGFLVFCFCFGLRFVCLVWFWVCLFCLGVVCLLVFKILFWFSLLEISVLHVHFLQKTRKIPILSWREEGTV